MSARIHRRVTEDPKFDPWDDGMMRDLFGPRLSSPLASFLIALEQIEKTEKSFGTDKGSAFDFLRPHLAALKDACVAEFDQR